jgi:hypothetical protein
MFDMEPHALTPDEWRESADFKPVQEIWGFDASDPDAVADFSHSTYAVKFHFFSGRPGYVGDLFILNGDALTGSPPVMLTRDEGGQLRLETYET